MIIYLYFCYLIVLVIALLVVVIVCVLLRYRKKHHTSSVGVPPATTVSKNAATIATANKEKELSENTNDNPTYKGLEENEHSTLPECKPAEKQDCEVSCDDMQ